MKSALDFLSVEDERALLERAEHVRYTPGGIILQEGEQREALFLIRTGTVRVERKYLGQGIAVAQRGPGDILGEMSFLEGVEASATVVAADSVEADILEGPDVRSLLDADPSLAARFYRSLAARFSQRLRDTTARLPPLLVEEVPEANRLAAPQTSHGGHDQPLAELMAVVEQVKSVILETGRVLKNSPEPEARKQTPAAHNRTLDGRNGTQDYAFRKQGEYWTITYEADNFWLKDARGLAYIAQLLRNPSRELHAIELVQTACGQEDSEPGCGDQKPTAGFLTDAGEVLDPQARAAYKQRLEDLREELEEARVLNDAGRVQRSTAEIEFLTHELARAVGLGGRARRAGSVAERARVNVKRAIASALSRIAAHHPALAEHLTRTIKTGTFCAYEPAAGTHIDWQL